MKCFFEEDRVCPINGYELSGTFCLACTIREVGKFMGKSMVDKAEADGVLYKSNNDKRPEVG